MVSGAAIRTERLMAQGTGLYFRYDRQALGFGISSFRSSSYRHQKSSPAPVYLVLSYFVLIR